MENRLQNLIISAQLTPKEKEVADYVLENLQKCCFMTSTELAGELNVSYSSVIRLTKTLGFTGYPDFQNYHWSQQFGKPACFSFFILSQAYVKTPQKI